ncbi:MAG: hypothetical protein AAGM38_15750 [Pseudomonadota bacterium]
MKQRYPQRPRGESGRGDAAAGRAAMRLLAVSAVLLGGALSSPASAASGACQAQRDDGYADGLAGAPRRAVAAAAECADPAGAYAIGYGAGRFVAGGAARAASPRAVDPAARAAARRERLISPGRTGASAERFARCRAAAARLSGRAGARAPLGCEGLAPTRRGLAEGRRLRAAETQSFSDALERRRLQTRLASPSLTRAEALRIRQRFRALDRAEANRRIFRPPPR